MFFSKPKANYSQNLKLFASHHSTLKELNYKVYFTINVQQKQTLFSPVSLTALHASYYWKDAICIFQNGNLCLSVLASCVHIFLHLEPGTMVTSLPPTWEQCNAHFLLCHSIASFCSHTKRIISQWTRCFSVPLSLHVYFIHNFTNLSINTFSPSFVNAPSNLLIV